MRQEEDKEIDGPDLERAEEKRRENELVHEKEDELYDLDGLPERFVDEKQSGQILEVMKTIMGKEHVVINDLKLPKRQQTALEALKTAVDGKDVQLSRFVFAEDRRTLLEQALAVLQPELVKLNGEKMFREMFDKVGELRERLDTLEDSEETLEEMGARRELEETGDAGDKDDDDDEGDDSDLDDAKKKQGAKAKSGPAKTDKQDEDTSLTGPERKVPPKGPTTLGDPTEIEQAAAANAPRWRRPGG